MGIASYVVIGTAVSLLVQVLKKKFGTESWQTLAIVLALSIFAGAAYYWIKDTAWYEPALEILGFAGAAYSFLIKRFD